MKKSLHRIYLPIIALFITVNLFSQSESRLYDIAKNIELYTNIYKELNKNFVDEIDPNILMKTGIDAMTKSLDPYTRYFSESDAESFRISTQGKYSGIGSVMKNIDSVITVVEMYKNSPAYKAGLKIGDQILEVNGKSTSGKSSKDVANIVRGAPNTEVIFKVKSFGESNPKEIGINRGEINIPNVPYSGLLKNNIGYIHLSTFTENAGKNVQIALKKLKDSVDLQGVILDLRGNGGGLLREAINIVNIFVDNNVEIVSTKGKLKEKNKSYKTTKKAFDKDIPLVVLINKRSASASEIVSGSIQDLDRGVLIGQKSFGKGLVQNIFPIGYNSKVKITISKYYIPSGRCIQSKIYDEGKTIYIDKEKRHAFKTKNNREVYDVGGIEPDILIEKEDYPDYVKSLLRNNTIFKYVNEFQSKHDSIPVVEDFTFDKFEDFKAHVDYSYKSNTEKSLDRVKMKMIDDGLEEVLGKKIDELELLIKENKKLDLSKYKETITKLIEKEIVKRYYFKQGKIRFSLINDEEVKKAIDILRDKSEYERILNPNK